MDLSSTIFVCIAITTPLIVLVVISQKSPVLMTIAISRNPGHLTHQECNGGAITLTTERFRKSTVVCSRCHAHAEFKPIYTQLFDFAKETGKEKKISVVRYRDKNTKGRLHIIPATLTHS